MIQFCKVIGVWCSGICLCFLENSASNKQELRFIGESGETPTQTKSNNKGTKNKCFGRTIGNIRY